jgi:hypothetical protein
MVKSAAVDKVPFKKAGSYTARKLRGFYGDHVIDVLVEIQQIVLINTKRGSPARYVFKAQPTTKKYFEEMRRNKFTQLLGDFVTGAFDEIEAVKEELSEWRENMPENLQDGEKGQELEAAVDALENIERLDLPQALAHIHFFWMPPDKKRSYSRPERLAYSVAEMQAAKDFLDEVKGNLDEATDELDTAVSEAECVDIPGMF